MRCRSRTLGLDSVARCSIVVVFRQSSSYCKTLSSKTLEIKETMVRVLATQYVRRFVEQRVLRISVVGKVLLPPFRSYIALRYFAQPLQEMSRWLYKSKEYTNFTYDLEDKWNYLGIVERV